MMNELLDFFLGAVHNFVSDETLLPAVDAVSCVICLTLVLGTACTLIIKCASMIFYACFGGNRNV